MSLAIISLSNITMLRIELILIVGLSTYS